MEEEKKNGSPLKGAAGYEICFLPTGRRREYLMGLWNSRAGRFELETVYSNLAEDRIESADGAVRLLLHTTRRLRTGEYRYGCFEPGKGWLAEGEHLHMERILISEEGRRGAETFLLWVYDSRKQRDFYRHRLYDGGDRMIGSFDSFHAYREPYEEVDYRVLDGSLIFIDKKDGKTLFEKALHQQ